MEFTKEEIESIYELIDILSGCNASNCFNWEGNNDITNPTTSAMVKIFTTLGKDIPEDLK